MESCNDEFVDALTCTLPEVIGYAEEAMLERIDRQKVARRERFYREYADYEIARITLSLMQEKQPRQSTAVCSDGDPEYP